MINIDSAKQTAEINTTDETNHTSDIHIKSISVVVELQKFYNPFYT